MFSRSIESRERTVVVDSDSLKVEDDEGLLFICKETSVGGNFIGKS